MNIASIIHETKSRYSYMYDETTLHIRIKTGKGEVKKIKVRGADPFNWIKDPNSEKHIYDVSTYKEKEMTYEGEDRFHDVWFCELKGLDTKRIRYGFILTLENGEEHFYGCNSAEDLQKNPSAKDNNFNMFNFPYLNDEDMYKAPSWAKDTVWCQITPGCYSDDGKECETHDSGNLKGLIKKLDYLKEIGFTGIYLTPIFESKSWHMYDTTDYFKVDERTGTNEEFKEFVDKAHSYGMKVMLDAVFNHCGPRHAFWQDVLKNGKNSKYYDCFYVLDDSKPIINSEIDENGDYEPEGGYDLNLRTFAYTTYMPKLNTGNPIMRKHLLDAGKYWVEEFGIDGWRLDVSNEVSHDFWRAFRKEVKGANPEVYIMGENWDDSYPWLQGDQFDTVMNYGVMNNVWGLILPENDQVKKITPTEFKMKTCELLTKYPKNVTEHMYNLVSSHDVKRILDLCEGDTKKLKLCYMLLLTYCGSPSVFFGDEVSMSNNGGESRCPMVWDEDKQDLDMKEFFKKLISLRSKHSSFKAMETNFLVTDNDENIVIFEKVSEDESTYVIINNSETQKTVNLPKALQNRTFTSLIDDKIIKVNDNICVDSLDFLIVK